MKLESIDTIAATAAKAFKTYCAARKVYNTASRAADKAETDLRVAKLAWERADEAFKSATKEQV